MLRSIREAFSGKVDPTARKYCGLRFKWVLPKTGMTVTMSQVVQQIMRINESQIGRASWDSKVKERRKKPFKHENHGASLAR